MARHAALANGKAKNGRASRRPSARSNDVAGLSSEVQAALQPAVEVLRRMARYKMEPLLARRMRYLGENKEFITKKEHDELLQLVEIWQKRTLDKLQAEAALQNLRQFCPKLLKSR